MKTFQSRRSLNHAPDAVFDAIQDPQKLARWWGPAGFTNRFDTFEFKANGKWIFSMIGPDGTVYPNQSHFMEIVNNARVVIRHDCAPYFTLTINLAPLASGTGLHWAQEFDDENVARAVAHIVEPANEQNLDRLSALLDAN